VRKFDINSLLHLPTSPVYCSHFTLENPKSHFSTVILFIHTSDYLRYLRRKQTVTPFSNAIYRTQCARTVPLH